MNMAFLLDGWQERGPDLSAPLAQTKMKAEENSTAGSSLWRCDIEVVTMIPISSIQTELNVSMADPDARWGPS